CALWRSAPFNPAIKQHCIPPNCGTKSSRREMYLKSKTGGRGHPLTCFGALSGRVSSGLRGRARLLDVALELLGAGRKVGIARLHEESVEAAIVFNRAQGMGGDAQ